MSSSPSYFYFQTPFAIKLSNILIDKWFTLPVNSEVLSRAYNSTPAGYVRMDSNGIADLFIKYKL